MVQTVDLQRARSIDLARWMFMLQLVGRRGLVPELAFFFKHPLGAKAARTFQDQLAALDRHGYRRAHEAGFQVGVGVSLRVGKADLWHHGFIGRYEITGDIWIDAEL